MNPTVPFTVAGDLATVWGRFATVAIVQSVVAATRLRMLTDPRLHPTQCRLSRGDRGPAVRDRIPVARDRIEVNARSDNHALLSIVSTICTTKITPGPDTGIGRWSEEAHARAQNGSMTVTSPRSGIGPTVVSTPPIHLARLARATVLACPCPEKTIRLARIAGRYRLLAYQMGRRMHWHSARLYLLSDNRNG